MWGGADRRVDASQYTTSVLLVDWSIKRLFVLTACGDVVVLSSMTIIANWENHIRIIVEGNMVHMQVASV